MTYHQPTSLKTALEILARSDAQILAGGTDLYPSLTGPALPGNILDITSIGELGGIEQTQHGWRIGATAKWSDITSSTLPPAFNALQEAAREVGSLQIQNSGTVVGNLCNASPAADGVPPFLILDAEVEIAFARGKRRVLLSEFIQDVRSVDLQKDEIVTALHIANESAVGASAFTKLGARKYLVISICMVAARMVVSNGKIVQSAISVGSCSPVALRLTALEELMVGQPVSEQATWRSLLLEQCESLLSPIGDIRADTEYRVSAAVELIDRTITRACRSAIRLDKK